ncbi:MAG: DUF177 domain-containing protein [Dehalococcoidia bacterium]|nr:DUF177 domain-containing protein [Dehalococcoidia bacterium]
MKINVAQLLKEPVGSSRRRRVDDITESGTSVQGEIELLRTNRSILVRGSLEVYSREICSRCLEEFECPVILAIEEEFFPTRDPISGVPLEVPGEPGAFTIDENNILDLGEAVRQYTLLERPMKPICRESCAGLCPQCGCNLNTMRCSCAPARAGSPLDALRDLIRNDGRD